MTVRLDTAEGRATITIDDPERRNPLSVAAMADMVELTAQALADDSVGVLVYTGTGEVFSAGGDLSGSFADDAIGLHSERGRLAELFRLMRRGGKPTVARVNGHALAGGFGLAAACDITIAVDDARLGVPEINVGLWPMMISAVLVRSMSEKAVLELMLTGRLIDAEEARHLGVVTRVVSRPRLDEAVDETVAGLLSKPRAVVALGRDAFYDMVDADFDAALDRLQGGLTAVLLSDDAKEGVAAFLEKRPPQWSGR